MKRTEAEGVISYWYRFSSKDLAKQYGINEERAKQIMENFHRVFPVTQDFWREIKRRELMEQGYKKVKTISFPGDVKVNQFRAGEFTTLEIYQKEPEPIDITNECKAVLAKSQRSHGFHVRIMHGEKIVAYLGDRHITQPGYKLEKIEGATLSFRIFKLP